MTSLGKGSEVVTPPPPSPRAQVKSEEMEGGPEGVTQGHGRDVHEDEVLLPLAVRDGVVRVITGSGRSSVLVGEVHTGHTDVVGVGVSRPSGDGLRGAVTTHNVSDEPSEVLVVAVRVVSLVG